MSEKIKGFTNGKQFREKNLYSITQKLFEQLGLSPEVEKWTPTVGVNIAHLARMKSIQQLGSEINGRALSVTILGISTTEGPRDFQRLLKALGAGHIATTAVDISDGIFDAIIQTKELDEIQCLLEDARKTGLASGSQDFVLRDHLGNCCPPEIDRAIDQEVSRILKPRGYSIVNITTSDLLLKSLDREVVVFERLKEEFGDRIIKALQNNIYDLQQFKDFPEIKPEILRGMILEIEPEDSFVVFGEDLQGHGEWFRTFADHNSGWRRNGLTIVEEASRPGQDSHEPKLECLRHNVLLKKL